MENDNLIKELSDIQASALQEMGNIGAGHAGIALSQLIEKKIMMAVTRVKLLSLEEFINLIGKDSLVVGIHLKVLVEIQAGMVLIFLKESALSLVDVLMKQKIGSTKILSDIAQSALKETGSILSAAYLNALTEMLHTSLIPSVPKIALDKAETVMSTIFGELLKEENIMLAIETEFIEASSKIKGYFLFVPGHKGIQYLLKNLGVKVKEEK
ncbi:MAG: chemotaxis protein CheC [Candidatus Omnitrophota bacterium]